MWSKFFYGIGDICTAIFSVLPSISGLVNGFFMAAITFGIIYWTVYEHRVNNKKIKNYLGGE
ncbi:MAG: hypothetical protein HKN22_07085 [Bacteroidia bacterium]|nr:hypothetical protein [Bacteroidia bacterium]